MEPRSLAHVVYTNIGRHGYGVVEFPGDWPRHDIERVADWLKSLHLSGSSSGYASGAFNFGGTLYIAVAVVHARFGSDQQTRGGGLGHAFLRSVSADPSVREIAPQSAMVDAAMSFAREIESRGESDPVRQLENYRKLCRRYGSIETRPALFEVLRHTARDTLPWLLEALTASESEKVLPLHSQSGLKPPQRLAQAAGLLPPRLALSATWGCWMRPHEDLRFVVSTFDAQPPMPRLSPLLEGYLDWLEAADLAALEQMLCNWEIRSYDDLAEELMAIRRAHPPSTTASVAPSNPSPVSHSVAPRREEMKVEKPTKNSTQKKRKKKSEEPARLARSRDPVTPEFLNKQLEAMRRELEQSVHRRFELLERSLGVPRGSSQPKEGHHSAPGRWHKIERPVVYSLLVLSLLGLGFLGWRELMVHPDAGEPAATASESADQTDPAKAEESAEAAAAGADAPAGDADAPAGSAGGTEMLESSAGSNSEPAESSDTIPFQEDWRTTWTSFADQDKAGLARWLEKLARREGLDEAQISNGQVNRFAGYVGRLKSGEALGNDLLIAQWGLFEYVVALWAEEQALEANIVIDLDRREIAPSLIRDLLSDLAPDPEPERQGIDDAELQAAVICSWIAR